MCINEQELTKDSYDDDDFLHTARSDTHHGLHAPLQITAHLSWTSAMLSIHLWTSTLAPYNLLLIYIRQEDFSKSVKQIMTDPYKDFPHFSL